MNPKLSGERAVDLAFFFTVLDIFDYKFSLDLQTIGQLFREDFKIFLINSKLRQIGGCPDISEPSARIFCSLYLVLASTLFTDLDDAVDVELHYLIKCIPKIIANNHLDAANPAQIDQFLEEDAKGQIVEQLFSKVGFELELASNLAKRRTKIV